MEWIRSNLMILIDKDEGEVIDWGNGVFTPVGVFVDMFGEIIQNAINNDQDVRQAIRDNDNNRGFANLLPLSE